MRLSALFALVLLAAGCGSGDNSAQTSADSQTPDSPATASASESSATQAAATPTPPATEATTSKSADPSVPQLISLATRLMKKGDLGHAVTLLTRAISNDPTSVDAYVQRAAAFAKAKLLSRPSPTSARRLN